MVEMCNIINTRKTAPNIIKPFTIFNWWKVEKAVARKPPKVWKE